MMFQVKICRTALKNNFRIMKVLSICFDCVSVDLCDVQYFMNSLTLYNLPCLSDSLKLSICKYAYDEFSHKLH